MKIKLPLIFLLIFSFVDAQVPSTWSSSSTYTSGALALDANGVTYIAQQDVSAGIALSNTTYWKSLDAAAPTSAPSTSAPTTTPDTSTVPQSTPDTNNTNQSTAAKLSNLSTRGFVGTGDAQMIAGFIVTGSGSTTVTIRALGPTIADAPYNVNDTISDPTLTIVLPDGSFVSNDNWSDASSSSAVQSSGRTPGYSSESAVQITVSAGSYTAIVGGANNSTGVALVEVYDESTGGDSIQLSNLSTRGFVGDGDSQMIAGFIVGGDSGSESKVTIRALGPTIADAPYNVSGTLTDPNLTIVDSSGNFISVDNWQSSTSADAIISSSKSPGYSVESAHQLSVAPGNYTAIVGYASGSSGVALVEVYQE
jgi:hypothetical protein